AQNAGHDIPLAEAVTSYINDVLRHRRDEATMIDPPTGAFTVPISVISDSDSDDDSTSDTDEDWRLKV
ncbi:MAG: DUF4032 domain-containing protein, partial [Mycetocola sp.]